VQIDFDVAREWAEAQDIPYSTYRSLAEHPRIKALVGEIIARMNATLPEAQRIEQAFVLPEELDPGAGALTALATPRRHAVRNRFADRLLATHLERDKTRPGGTMRIAIIGAGNVGGSLGKGWVERGHAVSFGVRNPAADKSKALAIECGGKAAVVSVQAAAARADVIVLATPWEVTETALRECGDLSGKIVVDCTNPLATDLADGLTLGHSDSGAERVAHWARGARVVKAFNSTGWNNMIAPKIGEQTAVMFVCGDDPQAKADVLALAMDLGFEAIDAGELKVARMLEPYALLWIHLAYRQGLGREYAFTLARRRIN
jgi:predicted dinucleotide-binding enzyme